ncbi:hypothetical protein [Paractinoplanes hotanensis]|uniref:Uncharacterized protein n=1 Tax=Paractinoplanes hotanensis TaxID=2906497 RepID=A0ABT0Y1U4_9ACTN|nr:hypothetical protein [Actinoplanes hotanensis]MCM4079994.1 hypothetical protein [Actinoplanes hotanensis]
MRRRGWLAAAAGVLVATGLAARHWPADEARAGVIAPPPRTVDSSVPDAKLLNSVLYVDDWRRFGNPAGFAYVPRSRPPGLIEISPGNPPNLSGAAHRGSGNGALLDGYRFRAGNARIFVVVEFAAGPTSTCADVSDLSHAICVRNSKPIRPEPDDVALRRTTAYFTANNSAALKSKEAGAAKQFWAEAEMVPAEDATWLTDLISRAEAAVLK